MIPDPQDQPFYPVTINLLLAAVGCGLFYLSVTGQTEVNSDKYGELVYRIPAEMWSIAIIVAAVMSIVGIVIIKGPLGCAVNFVSHLIGASIYSAFWILSQSAGTETIEMLYGLLFFTPLHIISACVALFHWGNR